MTMNDKSPKSVRHPTLVRNLIFLFIVVGLIFSVWILYMAFTHGAYGDPLWFLREKH
jgi:hypothetical protein